MARSFAFKVLAEPAHKPKRRQRHVFVLFVAGMSNRSLRAIRSVKRICENELGHNYDLAIVDLYRHPERASIDQIIAVPTLIRKLPRPLRRFIGDLRDEDRVLAGFKLQMPYQLS